MLYFLLFISVLIDTLKNIYYNYFGKNELDRPKDALLFNTVSCVGSVLFFVVSGAEWKISAYSFWMALVFAAVTAGAQYLALLSMSLGSMSYSVLFTYLSMLIPVVFGVLYYRQTVNLLQVIGLILMLVTFWMSVNMKKDSAVTLKWLFAAFGSFVFWGLVGVCQQLHQNSVYAGELNGFLLWTFILATVMFGILYLFTCKSKKNRTEAPSYRLLSSATVFAVISGAVVGAVNKINLYLSGKMPSVIFFPIVSGGVIILSGLAAILIFREKLSTRQTVGLIAGLASVLFLGI